MKKPTIHRLGDLQLQILKVLWDRGEAAVADVFEDVTRDTDHAYTTISTMLRKMEARGLITHRVEGRTFLYRAKIASEAVSRSMADQLVDRMFEGSLAAAVNHLLETRDVSRDELSLLEELIAERKKRK